MEKRENKVFIFWLSKVRQNNLSVEAKKSPQKEMSNIIGFLNVATGRRRNGAWFECNWPRQCRVKGAYTVVGTGYGRYDQRHPPMQTRGASVCAEGARGGECR